MTASPNAKAPTLGAASLNPDREKAAHLQARMAGGEIEDDMVPAVLRTWADGKAPAPLGDPRARP